MNGILILSAKVILMPNVQPKSPSTDTNTLLDTSTQKLEDCGKDVEDLGWSAADQLSLCVGHRLCYVINSMFLCVVISLPDP